MISLFPFLLSLLFHLQYIMNSMPQPISDLLHLSLMTNSFLIKIIEYQMFFPLDDKSMRIILIKS